MSNKMEGGYQLTRNLFDWCFENPDLINTNDIALYLWLVEKNNRCGWVEKMSVTASESMAACGFKTYPPYKKSFDKLIELGFIIMIKKSLNQYQCNIVALSKNNKATNKALDKASLKQSSKHLYSNRESTFDINKQRNNETNKPLNNETNNRENFISPKNDLIFPFDSQEFLNTWSVLKKEPKWKKKSQSALQASLIQLSKHTETDAIEMMNQSIAGNYQGIFELKKNNQNGKSNSNTNTTTPERKIGRITESELLNFIAPRHGNKPEQNGNFNFEK